jgi:hypothetical protein
MTSNDDNLVTLSTVSTEAEGQMLVNLLNEHGIAAVATGGFTSQFRAEAPGAVQVLVKRVNLPEARGVLAECERERCSSEQANETRESSAYEPSLTRFGIRCLLILELIAVAGILAAWGMGVNMVGGLVALLVSVLLVAAILTRRWSHKV